MLSINRGRGSIEPGQKLMITLRFLAAGIRFMSLQYAFRVAQITISLFVPKVFHAIYVQSGTKTRVSDVSPGKTEVKQGKFVEIIFSAKGYFRETYKSQNINLIPFP